MDKEKSVLVTGGAGYIGSHIVLACLNAGYRVVVIDRDEKACKHLQKCLSRRKKIKIFNADIENDVYLSGIFENESVGAIVHCAADISVPESIENPVKYYYNNTSKSIKLLEKAKKYGISKFVFSCTAAVYGEPPEHVGNSIPETHPCRPINAYGESKLMFETILKRHSEVNPNFKYASLRYFNVAGSDIDNKVQDIHWRSKGNIIPKILANVIDGRGEFKIFGTDYDTADGSCIRDYIHPTDLAKAHLLCIEKDVTGVFNLGTNRGTSVWEIVKEVVSVTSSEIDVTHSKRRKGDPKILVANPTRFMKETGWEPAYNISEIIRTAYKAYRKVK
jgi:UDP-glucose 4-epimerase